MDGVISPEKREWGSKTDAGKERESSLRRDLSRWAELMRVEFQAWQRPEQLFKKIVGHGCN